MKYFVSGVT